jgi:hypothetical protein
MPIYQNQVLYQLISRLKNRIFDRRDLFRENKEYKFYKTSLLGINV